MSKVLYAVEAFENEPSTLYVSTNRSDANRANSQIELLDALFFLDGEARLEQVQRRTSRRRGRANPPEQRFGMGASELNAAIESTRVEIANILKTDISGVPETLDEANKILLPRGGTPLYSDRREGAKKGQELMSLYMDIDTLEDLLVIKAIAVSLSEETFEKRVKKGTREFCINHHIIERLLASGVGISRDELKRLDPNTTFDDLDENAQDVILSALSFISMFISIDAGIQDAFLGLGPFQALAVMPNTTRTKFFNAFESIPLDSEPNSYGAHSFAPIIYALYVSAELGELKLQSSYNSLKALFSAISPEIAEIVTKFQQSSFTLASATAAISALRANEPLSNEELLQGLMPALSKLVLIEQEDIEEALELLPENECRVTQATFLATIFSHLPTGSLSAISTNNPSKLRGNFGVTSLVPFTAFAESIVSKLPTLGRAPSDNAMYRDFLEMNNPQLARTNFARWTFESMFLFSTANSQIKSAGNSAHITEMIKNDSTLIDKVVKAIENARRDSSIQNAARSALDQMRNCVVAGWKEEVVQQLNAFDPSEDLQPFADFLKDFTGTEALLPAFDSVSLKNGALSVRLNFQVCYALGIITSLAVDDKDFKDVKAFKMRNVTRNSSTATILYFESVPLNPLSLFAGLSTVGSCCVKPGDAGVSCAVSAYLASFDSNVMIYARDDIFAGNTFKESKTKKPFTGIVGIYTAYGIVIDPAKFSKSLKDNLEISTEQNCKLDFGPTEITLELLDEDAASEDGINVLRGEPFSKSEFRIPDNFEARAYGVPFRKDEEFKQYICKDYFANCTLPYESVIANLDVAFQATHMVAVQDAVVFGLKGKVDGFTRFSTNTYTDNDNLDVAVRSSFGFSNNINLSTMTRMDVEIRSEDDVRISYSNGITTLDTIETTLPVLRYMFSWPKGSNFMLTNGQINFKCTPNMLAGEDSFAFLVSNLMFPSWFQKPLGDIQYRHMVDMRFPKNGLTINEESIDKAEVRDLY